jgi:hypothetical protein
LKTTWKSQQRDEPLLMVAVIIVSALLLGFAQFGP